MALVILRVLRRWGELSAPLLDDLLQETYVALCANDYRLLRHFVERHADSLDAMLRVVASNVTHDQIRARNSQKRGGGRNQAYADLQFVESLDDETRKSNARFNWTRLIGCYKGLLDLSHLGGTARSFGCISVLA
jgi:DNA-directed RNA polymerase specialized sigma24 family protein